MNFIPKRVIRLLIGCAAGCALLAGCNPMQVKPSAQAVAYSENFELGGPEKVELVGDIHPALFHTADRDNENLEPVDIPVVPPEGSEIQVASGRYMITGYPVGNIFIYDEDGELILTEIVGDYFGWGSLTVDLEPSYTIRADGGYDSLSIIPMPTTLNTDSLMTGLWTVGLDVEAGLYEATVSQGYGYLEILEEGAEPQLYELIGGNTGKSASRIELKEGQVVRVTKTAQVLLEALE